MSKLVKCKTCGMDIAKTANVCPHCGAKQHTGAYVACVIIVVITLFLCLIIASPSKNEESDQSTSPSGTVSVAPENDRSIGIDGTLESKYFDISIVDVKWTDALETSLGTIAPKEEGNKLLCLIFSAVNTTDDTRNLGMFSAYVDKKSTLNTVVVGGIDDAMVFVGAVASGMEMVAYQVWELPDEWEEFQVNYFEADGTECKYHFTIYKEDI